MIGLSIIGSPYFFIWSWYDQYPIITVWCIIVYTLLWMTIVFYISMKKLNAMASENFKTEDGSQKSDR